MALRALALGLALAALLSGCSAAQPEPARRTVTVTASPAPAATRTVSATATAAAAPAGCRAGGGGIPAGATTRGVLDVDGDGRADTEWMAEVGPATRFGITTASGATFWHDFRSASPLTRTGFVARVRSDLIAAFFSDGRSADLLVVHDCALVQPRDPQGAPYTYDIDARLGTGDGVGCFNGEVVGLLLVPDGALFRIRRTVVLVDADGGSARNGPTTTSPGAYGEATAEVAAARTITCGSATVARSGVSAEP